MASPPVGVKVNLARCTGAEDCVRICPEVFEMDRYGYPMVRAFDGEDREIRTRLREAVARCPEGAIVLLDSAGCRPLDGPGAVDDVSAID